ncbi:hypothetical protein B0A52_08170 [Exophiala mesophila]|uniref:ORC6 first cyclin-like domain-containing protein n=1 Tax=Exophiala mesophila TaxID=212818 RepID=A0A438MV56_EXOME|nr:hypothetical protein B0A52_08170 [Exophiala mesophila]
MSSSTVRQSLQLLLPSHASKLPPSLVHLSESLLAQSRQRASNLKPEEEIARTHACCEIACRRLRAQCRLPAVKSGGAPCKPVVYKKLVAFLDGLLDEKGGASASASMARSKAAGPATPTSKKRAADGSVKSSRGDRDIASPIDAGTPSRTKKSHAFLGKIKTINPASALAEGELEAPKFTMPSIRRLGRLFDTPLLAPHVYTGTCIVLKLAGVWPPSAETDDGDQGTRIPSGASLDETVTGLLIALYLMTLTKMQTSKMTVPVYKAISQQAVQELQYPYRSAGVEEWIRCVNRDGYIRDQDWWENVPEAEFEFEYREDFAESEDDDDDMLSGKKTRLRVADVRGEEQDDPEGVLLPGLGTMMQESVDFLSDDRTKAFEVWKKNTLRKLDRMNKSSGPSGGRSVAVE